MFNIFKSKPSLLSLISNKKKTDNHNDVYILEDSTESYNNQSNNNHFIIDIPMLEELDNSDIVSQYEYEQNTSNYSLNNKTLYDILNERYEKRKSIYRFIKPRRLYKKYNYMEYPFYKNTK
jgi:hypothetical protein